MIGFTVIQFACRTRVRRQFANICLAEAQQNEFDLNTVGQNFVKWYHENYWTPHGNVLTLALQHDRQFHDLHKAKNLNSLAVLTKATMEMVRLYEFCLCFLFCLTNQSINATTLQNKFLQSLTDTSRSVIACFYYLEFAKQILKAKTSLKFTKTYKQKFQIT